MKSQQFIASQLKDLVKEFPKLTAKYEYDDSCQSHFIEIEPTEEFETNKDYIKFEKEIRLEFIEQFPFEILTFVSGEDGVDLYEPLIFKAKQKKTKRVRGFDFEFLIEGLFQDYQVDWSKQIHFKALDSTKFVNPNTFEILTDFKTSNTANKSLQNPEVYKNRQQILQDDTIENCDFDTTNDDYYLAA